MGDEQAQSDARKRDLEEIEKDLDEIEKELKAILGEPKKKKEESESQ